MPTILADTDRIIVKALGRFIKQHLGQNVRTVRGYVNRVSKPAGPDYVLITPISQATTSTNRHKYDPEGGTVEVLRPSERGVQIDFFGQQAEAWGKTTAILLRDYIGCDFLEPYGFAPLYVTDARDMTQPDGNENFAHRWMLEAHLHISERVRTEQDYFDGVIIQLRQV